MEWSWREGRWWWVGIVRVRVVGRARPFEQGEGVCGEQRAGTDDDDGRPRTPQDRRVAEALQGGVDEARVPQIVQAHQPAHHSPMPPLLLPLLLLLVGRPLLLLLLLPLLHVGAGQRLRLRQLASLKNQSKAEWMWACTGVGRWGEMGRQIERDTTPRPLPSTHSFIHEDHPLPSTSIHLDEREMGTHPPTCEVT